MHSALLLAAVLLCLVVPAVCLAAPASPLNAGTALGPAPLACKSYASGVHVPALDMAIGGAVQPFNGTAPYDQWPDAGRVRGQKPAMCREFVIPWSRQRN